MSVLIRSVSRGESVIVPVSAVGRGSARTVVFLFLLLRALFVGSLCVCGRVRFELIVLMGVVDVAALSFRLSVVSDRFLVVSVLSFASFSCIFPAALFPLGGRGVECSVLRFPIGGWVVTRVAAMVLVVSD